MAYAEGTAVPVVKSLSEIVSLIKKAGAERIAQAEEPTQLALQFFLGERMLRFRVTLPGWEDMPAYNGRNQRLSEAQRRDMAKQRHRQRARALLLVIKAKLESVESGVETFEEAFLSNIVMPDGKTVGQHTVPAIGQAYSDGNQPPLLLPMY